jgi:hypothetical protein
VIGSDRFGKKPDLIGLLGPARYFRADILARTPIPACCLGIFDTPDEKSITVAELIFEKIKDFSDGLDD